MSNAVKADIWDGQNKTINCPSSQTIEISNAEYGQPVSTMKCF